MTIQGLFTGGVKIRNLNGYLIAVDGLVYATTNTGGTTVSFFYQAKTSITSGDPGSGHLLWNNATQTSATQLNVSHLTDTPIEDIDLYLAAIVSGNKLIVQDRNDSERFQIWTVTGAPTQVGLSYWTIPVTLTQSAGAAFTNNHDLLFAIVTNSSGGGGITTNSITFNNSGSGAASGTSFNGGVAQTISYNTIGAQAANANLTSLAGLSYSSASFVKMTGANTFTLDTNTYLTANQTITLSGDVSGSGTTAITTTIGANKVTLAMLAQIATSSFLGRVTAATGNVEVLTATQATSLLNAFTSTLKGLAPASGGGTTNFLRADGTWAAPAGAGTTTNSATFNNSGTGAASGTTFNGGAAVTISYNTIGAQPLATNLTSLAGLSYVSTSFVKMTAAGTFSLDTNTYLTANQTITLSGDVSGSGTTAITTAIGSNKVTNAMLAQVSTATFHGRVTAGTGNIENLTGTQATTLLDVFTSTLKGLAPASGGGTTNFLRADGTWAAPSGGGGGTPAGSNTQIQYNNSGAFGASANLTWDGTAISAPLYKTTVATAVNTVYDAIILQNTTTATSSSNIAYSPAIHFKGSGYPTPGSAAVPIDMRMYLSSDSFAQASAKLIFDYSSNGSAYATAIAINASTSSNSTLLNLAAPGSGRVLETLGSSVLFGVLGGQHEIIFGDGNVAYFSFRTDASATKMSIRNYTGGVDLLTVFRTSGNVVIANTSDNGVDKLQVNGSMSVGSIKASGNVGIYNSSPTYALSIGDGTSTRQVVINGLNSGTAGGSSIAVQANSLTTVMFGNKSNVTGGAYDGQPVFGFGGSTNSLQFYNFNTTNVPAMISSGDKFLIGTTTDNGTDRLQVNGSAIATTLKITGGTSSQVLYADGSVKQITSGTASPSGGNDGDIYLQYV